jgi:hypothetical protein
VLSSSGSGRRSHRKTSGIARPERPAKCYRSNSQSRPRNYNAWNVSLARGSLRMKSELTPGAQPRAEPPPLVPRDK